MTTIAEEPGSRSRSETSVRVSTSPSSPRIELRTRIVRGVSHSSAIFSSVRSRRPCASSFAASRFSPSTSTKCEWWGSSGFSSRAASAPCCDSSLLASLRASVLASGLAMCSGLITRVFSVLHASRRTSRVVESTPSHAHMPMMGAREPSMRMPLPRMCDMPSCVPSVSIQPSVCASAASSPLTSTWSSRALSVEMFSPPMSEKMAPGSSSFHRALKKPSSADAFGSQ